jgi:hypothetical protein
MGLPALQEFQERWGQEGSLDQEDSMVFRGHQAYQDLKVLLDQRAMKDPLDLLAHLVLLETKDRLGLPGLLDP